MTTAREAERSGAGWRAWLAAIAALGCALGVAGSTRSARTAALAAEGGGGAATAAGGGAPREAGRPAEEGRGWIRGRVVGPRETLQRAVADGLPLVRFVRAPGPGETDRPRAEGMGFDADGWFRTADLRAGRYRLRPGARFLEEIHDAPPREVVVRAGAEVRVEVLLLTLDVRVERLRDDERASLLLRWLGPDPTTEDRVRSVRSLEGGATRIAYLAPGPGKARLEVEVDGAPLPPREIEVPADGRPVEVLIDAKAR